MINKPFKFSKDQKRHIKFFNNDPGHWNGNDQVRIALRSAIRRHYLGEQGYHCVYCYRLRQDYHGAAWDIDHIVPKSFYPQFTYEPLNLAIACKDCNVAKASKAVFSEGVLAQAVYPSASRNFLIIHPHFDNFCDHISVDYTLKKEVIHNPKTEKGVETFRICGLNRFSEKIAGTSETIPESGVTIGFLDDDFAKVYEEVKKVTSQYSDKPFLMAHLCEKLLAELTGGNKVNTYPLNSCYRSSPCLGESGRPALPPPDPKED